MGMRRRQPITEAAAAKISMLFWNSGGGIWGWSFSRWEEEKGKWQLKR
jgi:hypothetical protein